MFPEVTYMMYLLMVKAQISIAHQAQGMFPEVTCMMYLLMVKLDRLV